jgi:hypothetical protein
VFSILILRLSLCTKTTTTANHGLAKAGAFGVYSTFGIYLKFGMNCKSEFLFPTFAKPQTVGRHGFTKTALTEMAKFLKSKSLFLTGRISRF